MRLIIGGKAQGKLQYAKDIYGIKAEEICNGSICSREAIYDAYCIDSFHQYVKRFKSVDISRLRNDVTVICDEVGMGVVPVSEEERDFRENTGRLCCDIAGRAESVERIFCGTALRIK